MLYHSPLKFYAKGLLGKKNASWYFDRMIHAYERKNDETGNKIIEDSDCILASETIRPDGFTDNPLFEKGLYLRNKVIADYSQSLADENITAFIQVPPANYFTGHYSWFANMADTLQLMGAQVFTFWDEMPTVGQRGGRRFIIFGYNDFYTKNINWDWIDKEKQHGLTVFTTCNLLEKNPARAHIHFNALKTKGVDHCFGFYHSDYIAGSVAERAAGNLGMNIYSLRFGANPAIHYPTPYVKAATDYVFLASANYDKALRSHHYFYPVIKKYNGLIAGPGWPWCANYVFNPSRDRWVYAQASVGLNLHIDSQINEPTELNERAYILAACGIPQVTDNAMLIDKEFSCMGKVASNPVDYLTGVGEVLNNREQSTVVAGFAMTEVFTKHTTFHRVDEFLRNAAIIKN